MNIINNIIHTEILNNNKLFSKIENYYLNEIKIPNILLGITIFKYLFFKYKYILLISFFVGFFISTTYIISSLYTKHIYIKLVNNTNNLNKQLKSELYDVSHEKIKYKNELNKLINSKNFKRFFIYNNTNIFIPKNIDSSHLVMMEKYRNKYNIPIDVYYKQINQESKFNNNALSNKGAFGYCQLMKDTYKQYLNKLNLSHSIESQIHIGAYYLYEGYKISNSWEKALRRYNSGSLNGYNSETNNYIKIILK